VNVYVAYDDRISRKPSWLTSSFTNTGDKLVRDNSVTFSIYVKAYQSGHVSLGGNSIPSGGAGGMYVVIVKPLGNVPIPQQPTQTPTSTPIPQTTPTKTPTSPPTPTSSPKPMLLFDGTIKASDHRNGNLGSSMAGYGAYNGWYCIPQSDSFTTIPAPGGRTGYAVKVIARPGLSACGSTNKDQHLQLTKIITGMPTTLKEVWIGWSTMLDSSWQPQGAGAWEHFGIALTILSFKLPNTGLYTDIGTSDTSITITNNLRFNQPALSAVENTKGVWNDWMFHVKWAKDNTGFIELYHKTGTNQYTKTYSIYNVATLNPSNPNNDFDVRLGLYRSELSKSTQIFYSQGIKVGTNRADVEYKAN
jgi:hypothetical protein